VSSDTRAPAPGGAATADRTGRRRLRRALAPTAVALLGGSNWVVEPVRVESDSMSPTLRPGGRAVLLHAPWAGAVTRGDAVVVGPGWGRRSASTTAGQGAPAQSSVKRVWFGPVTVPEGAVHVLGDDRARSVDSRELGPVPLEEVEGRVVTPWPLG
jgi:signal peptidase I